MTKKIARLPDGLEIVFPDNMSDSDIKASIKQMVKKTDMKDMNMSMDQIINHFIDRTDNFDPALTKNIDHLSEVIKEVVQELIEAQDTEATDHFGPAISKFLDFFRKNETQKSGLKNSIYKEVISKLVIVGNNVEILSHTVKNSTDRLITSQRDNTKALRELVNAYQAPKTILRDKDDRIKGIK